MTAWFKFLIFYKYNAMASLLLIYLQTKINSNMNYKIIKAIILILLLNKALPTTAFE